MILHQIKGLSEYKITLEIESQKDNRVKNGSCLKFLLSFSYLNIDQLPF